MIKYILRNSCKEIRYLSRRTKFVLDEDTERSGGWEEHRPLCEHGSDYPPLGEAHLITLPSYSSSSLSSSHCHLQHHQAESLSTAWCSTPDYSAILLIILTIFIPLSFSIQMITLPSYSSSSKSSPHHCHLEHHQAESLSTPW